MSTITMNAPASVDTPHETPLRPGRVTIADVAGVSVWFYVVALLPGRDAYGVNLGTNATRATNPLSWAVGTIVRYPTDEPVTYLTGDLPGALVDFLRPSGLAVPTSGGPEETTDQAYRRGVTDGRSSASREFEAWKARAEEIAHEYADRNELCSEFDRCMEEVGLSPRGGFTYRIVVDVTLPRGRDPRDMDLDDLYSESEDTSMVDVTRV